jgi:hypothetical protein
MSDVFTSDDARAVEEMLRRGLAPVAPSADLLDRIVARVREEEPRGRVLPFRRRPVALAAGAAAAAAAAAVALTLAVSGGDRLGSPSAQAAIVPHEAARVSGTARLYDPHAANGVVVVSLRSLPPAPAGHNYEVWVLRKGSKQMTAVGSFTPRGKSVELRLPLPAPGDYAALDVSVQQTDGPPQHSGESIAGATFA